MVPFPGLFRSDVVRRVKFISTLSHRYGICADASECPVNVVECRSGGMVDYSDSGPALDSFCSGPTCIQSM